MVVIELRDQEQWSEVTLAKRYIRWAKEAQKTCNPEWFDFSTAIAKEEEIIRSFMENVRDQQAA